MLNWTKGAEPFEAGRHGSHGETQSRKVSRRGGEIVEEEIAEPVHSDLCAAARGGLRTNLDK